MKCAPPALGAGAALAAMLFASRLPITLDFILPRRAGWPLFQVAHEALSRSGPREAFTAGISLIMLASLARFGWLLAAAVRGRRWSGRDFLARGLLVALVLFLTRWSFAIWFEVSQKVWFPYGSLDAWEPLVNLLVCALIAFCAMTASLAGLSPRPAPLRGPAAWTAVNALAAFAAFSLYGAWSPGESPAESRRLFVVLTEEEGRPGQAAYDLPVAAERDVAKAGVHRLESLRALYERRAKLMDPAGLRSALMLGMKHHDDLARSLLLDHLSVAPPSPGALGALGALADETAHRIGPMGASRIALAYARLGDAAQAAVWARRGAEGPRGIPAGLLDLTGGGALAPGRVSGKIEGLKPLRIALYRKADPAAPYLLDAAALVASAAPDARGRFSFSGLPAGRYYLALAFEVPGRELRVRGHRGDLTLDARKPALELPLLSIK
ncbi:MAG: carboxypeptidase-like regulatory domain-containing protein [Elusimicrobia bacterium]|nr:carboxypeptidase-like regulatory domain-containing protein [Elusimicrobiota bacterium]